MEPTPLSETWKGIELQQLEVPGHLVDLCSIVWPNSEARSRRLAVKFGMATVCDQMNLKPHFDRLVVISHQFLFAVEANADFRTGYR